MHVHCVMTVVCLLLFSCNLFLEQFKTDIKFFVCIYKHLINKVDFDDKSIKSNNGIKCYSNRVIDNGQKQSRKARRCPLNSWWQLLCSLYYIQQLWRNHICPLSKRQLELEWFCRKYGQQCSCWLKRLHLITSYFFGYMKLPHVIPAVIASLSSQLEEWGIFQNCAVKSSINSEPRWNKLQERLQRSDSRWTVSWIMEWIILALKA